MVRRERFRFALVRISDGIGFFISIRHRISQYISENRLFVSEDSQVGKIHSGNDFFNRRLRRLPALREQRFDRIKFAAELRDFGAVGFDFGGEGLHLRVLHVSFCV